MAQEQGIVKGDTLQKISSISLIIGAILLLIGNILLMIYFNNINSIAKHPFFYQFTTLLSAFGIWALLIGMTGIYRSITTGGVAWARIGFYFIIVGTALWTTCFSVDIVLGNLKDPDTAMFTAIRAFGHGVYPMTIIVHGIAYTFICSGIIGSVVYPRWIGWVGLFVSIAVVIIGILWTLNEKNWGIFQLIFSFPALLITLWTLFLGIWVAKKAW